MNRISLIWDLTKEQLTLGGALVLRQEGEILAKVSGLKNILLSCIVGDKIDVPSLEKIISNIFYSSGFCFEIIFDDLCEHAWPSKEDRSKPFFSYFSFSRLVLLYGQFQIQPHLTWDDRIIQEARTWRSLFPNKLVCLHLKNVAPFAIEESTADGLVWNQFIENATDVFGCDFILLGDDAIPQGIKLGERVKSAKDLGIDLAIQLAMISISDAFFGMASGVCTAANLSPTPYFIYKHPNHHMEQMKIELGESDSFVFASDLQKIKRSIVTSEILMSDLRKIL